MTRARAVRPNPVRAFVFDVGLVLAAWAGLVAIENLVVGIVWRDEILGPWEMTHTRTYLAPLALGASFPIAMGMVVIARLGAARRARELAALGALGGVAIGVGVSAGRHFESWAIRAPFVAAIAAACAVVAWIAARRAPIDRPRILAGAGALIAMIAWLADAFVLPRLYPAFHSGVFVVTLGGWAMTVLAIQSPRIRGILSIAGLVTVTASLAWTPRAALAIRGDDNLRRVLYEHAPLLGRAVSVASRIAPPAPLDEGTGGDAALTAATVRGATNGVRALDWRGKDIVLVTIDALRADHVSAYGYGRKTTPNIDRIAAGGARFEHAYCPTPHTSYSVASMMTGKYMRPLLTIGAGEGSETWPLLLRRYGYQTGAFYPPAVFFIDEQRFTQMSKDHLSFEYFKVEFAKPELRSGQIEAWLAASSKDRNRPRFLWVHLFEPHEPYEMHASHPFPDDDRSAAYDSEIATADEAVGDIVDRVRARSPGAVVIVSADHGEELGDHGGRYHGTTVYEEQVRVPLVIVGPGIAPRVIATPVQTIDLLPTTLAALDIPMPARIRGRDLGGILAGNPPADEGLAFSETDDWTMVARGSDRLVCARKLASCSLFDVAVDPGEKHAIVDRPPRVTELRRLGAAIERENGRLEGTPWPEALRRAMQGDRDAAEDVAPLLDDADVRIRRATAKVAFQLRAPEISAQLSRAATKDEDREVRAWSSLAVARLGLRSDGSETFLSDADPELRLAAALVLAEHGDGRGEAILVDRWIKGEADVDPTTSRARDRELGEARDLLGAFAKIRAKTATLPLVRSLDDVRLRPTIVETLGAIGDPRARDPLLAAFAGERYVHMRPIEARALVALGVKEPLRAPLTRFAGVPEPMLEAITIAHDAKLLQAVHGGASFDEPKRAADVTVTAAAADRSRLIVLAAAPGAFSVSIDGAPQATNIVGEVGVVEIGARAGGSVRIRADHPAGVRAIWLVPRSEEIPPPPPEEWDAGASPAP